MKSIGISLGGYAGHWQSEGLSWQSADRPHFLGLASLSLDGTVGRGLGWSLSLPYLYGRNGASYGSFREYVRTPQGDVPGKFYHHRAPAVRAFGAGDVRLAIIPPARRIYSVWSLWIPTDRDGPEPLYHRADDQARAVAFRYPTPWLSFQVYRIGYFGAFRSHGLSLSVSTWLALHDPAGEMGQTIQPGDASATLGAGSEVYRNPTQRTSLRMELGYSTMRWEGKDGSVRRTFQLEPSLSHTWTLGGRASFGLWAGATALGYSWEDRRNVSSARNLAAGMRYEIPLAPPGRPAGGG